MKKQQRKNSSMKKCAVLLAAAMLLATGCGQEEKTIEGSVQNMAPVDISGGEESAAGGGEAQGASEGQEQAGQSQGSAQGSGATDGYLFTVKGVTIAMDADAAPILEQLGEAASYFESTSCAFEGLDKTYTYNGFELDTYPTGDKDYVSAVVLKDDSVSTPEGICIGDSRDKVLQAYPDGGTEEGGMIIYKKGDMKLCFILKEDEVASIEYRSTILE